MNRLTDEVFDIKESTPPEIPPDFPFPPQPPKQPAMPVPMIYVHELERVEYKVTEYEKLDAKQLEHDLHELGRDGWWLTQFVTHGDSTLIIFCRTGKD